MNILMKCGCRANATCNGKPVCAIHIGLTPDAEIQAETPNLAGRKAKCCYCNSITESRLGLPFFAYKPEKEMDEYFCGCMGWD